MWEKVTHYPVKGLAPDVGPLPPTWGERGNAEAATPEAGATRNDGHGY